MTLQSGMPPELLLPARAGLPQEIAYLRDAYPKPQWQAHRNYGQLTAFWLQVHDSLRDHGKKLKQMTQDFREGRLSTSDFPRLFVPRLNQYLQHLKGHHQIEDGAYFPKFRALDRRMVTGFDLLENDHDVIHKTLLVSADSARNLLGALQKDKDALAHAADACAANSDKLLALLVQHLADEEDLVIPAMLEHGERSIS